MLYKLLLKTFVVAVCLMFSLATAQNIVSKVAKAPINPSGDVQGKLLDIILPLNIPMDPAVEGRSLKAGKTIKVVLPSEVIETTPDLAFGTPASCPAAPAKCNVLVMVQGWPQRPIPFNKFTVSFEAPSTIVITAKEDIGPSATGPGIKVLHVNLAGFTNPIAGQYNVEVIAETGPDGAIEHGTGVYTVLANNRPSIHTTSILSTKPGTNLIFQNTAIGQESPLPLDLLLWDANGQPMNGVSIAEDGTSLIQNGSTVGSVSWDVPVGSQGFRVYSSAASTERPAPLSGTPVSHLVANMVAGNLPGKYKATFSLNGGTSQSFFLTATDPNAGDSYSFVKVHPTTSDSKGNNILANCGQDYPHARANMNIMQSGTSTDVDMMISNARPNTLFTVWFWLKAKDQNGNTFGGNPLSGKSGAPFAPSTAYEELLAATGAGNGVTEGANVFTTDANGNGAFSTILDYPMFGGAYPFHKITSFDASDSRLPIDNARIYPVALLTPSSSIDMPFMVRLASHCTDGLSHGWTAGAREPWFDFPR